MSLIHRRNGKSKSLSFIYFISCEPMGSVKIGFTSSHPNRRLRALQTGCPSPLILSGFFPGSMDEEGKLHEAFAPLHIQGEWFRYSAKLRDFIGYMADNNDNAAIARAAFECALHDVLLTGLWYPDGDVSEEEYNSSANWAPFQSFFAEDI